MIRDPEVTPRIPVADADGKFVATPMELGLATCRHGRACRARPHRPIGSAPHALLTHARRMYPALAATIAENRLSTWMGHRPSLPDSLPVIGARAENQGCRLCLRARPCRHGLRGQDRQDGRRDRCRRNAADRCCCLQSSPLRLTSASLTFDRHAAAAASCGRRPKRAPRKAETDAEMLFSGCGFCAGHGRHRLPMTAVGRRHAGSPAGGAPTGMPRAKPHVDKRPCHLLDCPQWPSNHRFFGLAISPLALAARAA